MHLYLCYLIAYNNFTIFLKSGEKMVRRLFSYVVHVVWTVRTFLFSVRLAIHSYVRHIIFLYHNTYMLVLLSLHCFGLLRGDSCPSVDVWGWKKPREQASSFCIFWWRLVLWQMCWYTVEIRLCERDRESHRRTRERLFPATPALSSGTTLPLFSPLS